MERYDAIVIGAGLGGLGAAALLARAGKRVLVLERNADFGGAATVYRHGRLAIEASLHETDGFGSEDPQHGLFHRLGVAGSVELVRVPELYEVRSPLLRQPFRLPEGFEAATEAGVAAFPEHADGVRRYFRAIEGVCDAFGALASGSEHKVTQILGTVVGGDLWQLLKRARASTKGVLDECFGEAEAPKLALAANLTYLDDNPARLWFPMFAVMLGGYLRNGGHYLRGGSRALTQRLVDVIRSQGGAVLAQSPASEIVLDVGGRAAGVRWRDASGQSCEAATAVVLGNAAPEVLAAMLPDENRARFAEPYGGLEHSISLFTVSLGVSQPPSRFGVSAYSTFVMPDWLTRIELNVENGPLLAADPGARMPAYALVDYARIDSGLNTEGVQLLSIAGVDRLVNWQGLTPDQVRARKERWIDALVADLERHYPGITASIVQREMSTAQTMQQYLNTPAGAVYGFAPSVSRFSRPPSAKTAVEGLYLASAYTACGGFAGALSGGMMAAQSALRELKAAA